MFNWDMTKPFVRPAKLYSFLLKSKYKQFGNLLKRIQESIL